MPPAAGAVNVCAIELSPLVAAVPPLDVAAEVPTVGRRAVRCVGELKAPSVTVDYRIVAGAKHGSTALDSFTVQQGASEDAHTWIAQARSK